jgi:hypothetical protein
MTLATTKLDAVNQMLSSIGEAPAVSLDTDNPEIAIAESTLDEISRTVQAEGWNFNTEYEYPFTPDGNGEILIPSNILSIADNKVKSTAKYLTVVRNGKLYDKLTHSYQFTGTVYCDVIWAFEFSDLPQPFKDYITTRAARVYASRVVGSEEQVKLIVQDEAFLRANCLTYDTDTAEPNIFGLANGQNFYISYTPFNTIVR